MNVSKYSGPVLGLSKMLLIAGAVMKMMNGLLTNGAAMAKREEETFLWEVGFIVGVCNDLLSEFRGKGEEGCRGFV